jgi:hypothetical protein
VATTGGQPPRPPDPDIQAGRVRRRTALTATTAVRALASTKAALACMHLAAAAVLIPALASPFWCGV